MEVHWLWNLSLSRIYFEPIFIRLNEQWAINHSHTDFSLTFMEKLWFQLLILWIIVYKSSNKNLLFCKSKKFVQNKQIRQKCIYNNNKLFWIYLLVLHYTRTTFFKGFTILFFIPMLALLVRPLYRWTPQPKWKYKINWIEFQTGFWSLCTFFF